MKKRYSVLIIGGGPCGLMLANEPGRRDISVLLIDEKLSTALNPQADANQARTMEHFRRLGFADEVRALAARVSGHVQPETDCMPGQG